LKFNNYVIINDLHITQPYLVKKLYKQILDFKFLNTTEQHLSPLINEIERQVYNVPPNQGVKEELKEVYKEEHLQLSRNLRTIHFRIKELINNYDSSSFLQDTIDVQQEFYSFTNSKNLKQYNLLKTFSSYYDEGTMWNAVSYCTFERIVNDIISIFQNKCIQHSKNIKEDKEQINTFEELFHNQNDAEPCLNILRELNPAFIDAENNYIGKNKGIFPLWINILKSHKPYPIIKHFSDLEYKEILNKKIKKLNLTRDASEFRKTYKRLINSNIKLDIKTLISQISQSGKLGK